MKKHSVKTRVMDFVQGRGEASYMEIIKFIVEEVKGMKYMPWHRGYYSGAFSGYSPYFTYPSKHESRFLEKNTATGKWYVIKG